MPVSVFLLLSRSALQTGTGKSQFESAQKTTAVGANREIFGFDLGEGAERTAILTMVVEKALPHGGALFRQKAGVGRITIEHREAARAVLKGGVKEAEAQRHAPMSSWRKPGPIIPRGALTKTRRSVLQTDCSR
ncbi:hypothetical protein [Bradyrhizobium ganzhouense]|uniref:hypothetical protein n=1 Tax=Bradyrhizobium ganzhouense TaxID=1179767 RepID=UPI003CF31611